MIVSAVIVLGCAYLGGGIFSIIGFVPLVNLNYTKGKFQ